MQERGPAVAQTVPTVGFLQAYGAVTAADRKVLRAFRMEAVSISDWEAVSSKRLRVSSNSSLFSADTCSYRGPSAISC